ncbi:hypothetical protein [Streptomyces tsukubensis]|uniref:hypothetical protein n=1 Tax=Streptomyces tsukubensis TaxID=83656 RepID=UPI00344E9696
MIQHLNLVFQAGGLDVGEFAFLMACCNHTDDRGNVIAKMQQLADEAHMPLSTARAKKSKLIKRGLLARGERFSPKNKAQLADLVRVNLELLASMKRPRVDYGPTLVEELTFAAPQETPSSDPPLKSSGGGAESQRGGRSDSAGAPLESSGAGALNPSTLLSSLPSPSSLSGAPEVSDASVDAPVGGEREAAAPEGVEGGRTDAATAETSPAGAGVAGPGAGDAGLVLAAYEEALGGPALGRVRGQILEDAAELLAARPLWWVQARARELPAYGVSLAKHAGMSKAPFTTPPVPGQVAGGRERCPDHPARYRRGCMDCAMAVPA